MDLDEVKIDKSTKMANHIATSMFSPTEKKQNSSCL